MSALGNFKIGTRLGAGFALVLLLLCVVGGVSSADRCIYKKGGPAIVLSH